MTDSAPLQLPDVATITAAAPFRWLRGGWSDFKTAPIPCLIYGILLAALSAALTYLLYYGDAFNWILVLAGGFLIVAPMLAMGLYEAGRQLEIGQKPSFKDMALVKGAFRRDLAYLGLALFLIYLMWTRVAQVLYALSTNRLHKTPQAFLEFMFTDPSGQMMALIGTIVGGVIVFLAYTLVVISVPMMLDRRTDVFIATVTSVRAVVKNTLPMLIWALLIAALTAIGIATAFLGLIIVFPVIGLASWRAYRELVPTSP